MLKMIKIIPSEDIKIQTLSEFGSTACNDIININSSKIIAVTMKYDKSNINYRENTYGEFTSYDSTIGIILENNHYYRKINCYFKDTQYEYQRILHELGIDE